MRYVIAYSDDHPRCEKTKCPWRDQSRPHQHHRWESASPLVRNGISQCLRVPRSHISHKAYLSSHHALAQISQSVSNQMVSIGFSRVYRITHSPSTQPASSQTAPASCRTTKTRLVTWQKPLAVTRKNEFFQLETKSTMCSGQSDQAEKRESRIGKNVNMPTVR